MTPTNYIYKLFGSSPFRPLQKHMEKVSVCVAELVPLFEAVIARDLAGVEESQEKISQLEREADEIKKQLRMRLPKELFLPVPRSELLDLLRMQDNIANKSKDIAGLIRGRMMSLPEGMGPLFIEFVKRSIDATSQAQKAINELDELVEAGFRGNEVELVENMIQKLDEIESDTDTIEVEVRAKLFEMEKDLPPIDVMFIYQIIQWIGGLADLAQRVGSRLQLLLAK